MHACYERKSNRPFDAYRNMLETWSSENNTMHEDYELYSSEYDMSRHQNEWQSANYDDEGVGFPRDCGQRHGRGGMWCTIPGSRHFDERGARPFAFYVAAEPLAPTPMQVVGFAGFHAEDHSGRVAEGGACDGRGMRCVSALVAPLGAIASSDEIAEVDCFSRSDPKFEYVDRDGMGWLCRRTFSDMEQLRSCEGCVVREVRVALIASAVPGESNLCVQMVYSFVPTPEHELALPRRLGGEVMEHRGIEFRRENATAWLPRLPWLPTALEEAMESTQAVLSYNPTASSTVQDGDDETMSLADAKGVLKGTSTAKEGTPSDDDRIRTLVGPTLTVVHRRERAAATTQMYDVLTPELLGRAVDVVGVLVLTTPYSDEPEDLDRWGGRARESMQVAQQVSAACQRIHGRFLLLGLVCSAEDEPQEPEVWSRFAAAVEPDADFVVLVPCAATQSARQKLRQSIGPLPRHELLLLNRSTGRLLSEPGCLQRWRRDGPERVAAAFPWTPSLKSQLRQCAAVSSDAAFAGRIDAASAAGEGYFVVYFADASDASSRATQALLAACATLTNPPHVLAVYADEDHKKSSTAFAKVAKGAGWGVLRLQDTLDISLQTRLCVTASPALALLNHELQLLNPNALANVETRGGGDYPWAQNLIPTPLLKDVDAAHPAAAEGLVISNRLLMPDFDVHGERMIERDGAVVGLYRVATLSAVKFLEVRVLVQRKVLQLWALIETGRRVYRRLVLSSHNKFCLMNGKTPHVLMPRNHTIADLEMVHSHDILVAAPLYMPGRSMIIHRQRDEAMFVVSTWLEGVLPAVLCENFRFWNTGDAIVGEPVEGGLTSLAYNLFIELPPLTDDPQTRVLSSSVQRLSGKDSKADEHGLRLVDLLERPKPGSFVWRVAQMMSRLDALSHVLAWASEEKGLELIELPRIGTSFQPRRGPHGETLLFNCDFGELSVRARLFLSPPPFPPPLSLLACLCRSPSHTHAIGTPSLLPRSCCA